MSPLRILGLAIATSCASTFFAHWLLRGAGTPISTAARLDAPWRDGPIPTLVHNNTAASALAAAGPRSDASVVRAGRGGSRPRDAPAAALVRGEHDGAAAALAADIAADIARAWRRPAARAPEDADAASFRWSDLDLNRTIPCGNLKCFFHSVRDPARGYLAWRAYRRDKNEHHQHALEIHMAAYDFARRVERDHAVRQFLTGPPVVVDVPHEVRKALRNATYPMGLGKDFRFSVLRKVAIQPSRTAPDLSATFKCSRYVGHNHTAFDKILELSTDKPRLLKELTYTLSLLDVHPSLALHFQILVGVDGRVYHLDFDRVPLDTGRSEKEKAEDAKDIKINIECLENMIREVQEAITTSASLAAEIAADVAQTWRLPAESPPDAAASFRWSDLDLNRTIPCGAVKCFFRSASDPARGYWAWDAGLPGRDVAHPREPARHAAAYDFARRLEGDRSVRQFPTGPPFLAPDVPDATRRGLRDATYSSPWGPEGGNLSYPALRTVAVQPSRAPPERSKIFKCSRYLDLRKDKGHGLDKVLGRSKDKLRLLKELGYTLSLFDNNVRANWPLSFRFRLLIGDDGRVYHIDLDRLPLGAGHSMDYAEVEANVAETTKETRKCLLNAIAEVRHSIFPPEKGVENSAQEVTNFYKVLTSI